MKKVRGLDRLRLESDSQGIGICGYCPGSPPGLPSGLPLDRKTLQPFGIADTGSVATFKPDPALLACSQVYNAPHLTPYQDATFGKLVGPYNPHILLLHWQAWGPIINVKMVEKFPTTGLIQIKVPGLTDIFENPEPARRSNGLRHEFADTLWFHSYPCPYYWPGVFALSFQYCVLCCLNLDRSIWLGSWPVFVWFFWKFSPPRCSV